MSEKKSTFDMWAESHIPSDLLTPSLGSNYGLDGYPDMEYGAGVLEGVLEPDNLPAPALPTGLSKGAAGEMDLSGVMQEAPITDLSWLDSGKMDLERLPETPESIPELEDAWGYSTNGVQAPHLRDLDHAKQASKPSRKANARTLTKVAQHAMRRSIEGHDIDDIVRSSLESMGSEMSRVAKILKMVREDHGLSGNVFIRSSAYPNWGTGKWKAHAKKFASGAKYIVVSDSEKTASWVQDGRCTYTGKKVVTEVPWKEAHAHYSPRLEASGRTASGPDVRAALQNAFLSSPARKQAETVFPTEHREGTFEIGSAFRAEYDVGDSTERHMLASVEAFDWGNGEGTQRIRSASEIEQASAPATPGIYAGTVETEASLNHSVKATLSGDLSEIARVASETGRSASEIRSVVRTARKAMSEGMAGKDLTSYLDNRFSNGVLNAARGLVANLREAHEGLSGFLYVDAEAYASPNGVSGCESGAVRHRANQIRNVRAMDRCATCTLARVREDGTRKCGAYNKVLVEADDVAGPEMTAIKNANIKSVGMSDAEATGSLFAPSFDSREFGLVNANLEGFTVDDLPEHEKMASILFDGWRID